ncbi:MAG: B12-binding domain-containing radical SAM protein [Pseudomonadota bacterium]
MKILLIYPELPLSFWSFPQTVRYHFTKALFAPLGPLTVAAFLPEEWNIRFVDLNTRKLTEKDWAWGDIVMISGMLVQKNGFLHIIREAQKRSKLTVAGGPCPSLVPDELIEAGCDLVVKGEMENTIDLLLACIQSGQSGQIIATKEKPDLSGARLPRYDLINLKNYHSYLVQTTRGCPYNCEFCDIADLYGKLPRCKTPDQVVAELEHLYTLGARGTVLFADDNFIANTKNAKAICSKIIEWNSQRHEPFGYMTQASINLGQDLEMIDLMTAANFGEVFIGIESPDEAILTAHHKHQNVANPLLESIENIKRNGLSIIGSFIIGFDNEKKGAGKRICDFVEQTDIPIVMPNLLTAPPGTKLRQRLINEGRMRKESSDDLFGETNSCLPNFVPTRPLAEVVEEYIEMWEYLYEPSRFFARTYRFCLAIRPTRKAMATSGGEKAPHYRTEKTTMPLKTRLGDFRIFLHFIWNHGMLSPYRIQFWKQLIGMQRENPSRLVKYIAHCIQGEEHFRTKVTIRNRMRALMKEAEENI